MDRYIISETNCWIWQGCITATGYSRIWDKRLKKVDWGHRVFYRSFVGTIPKGLTLDHLCRNRACVNPNHLEPVTSKINVLRGESQSAKNARKTHCPQGHEYNFQNTHHFTYKNGAHGRHCRKCHAIKEAIRRKKLKEHL